VFVAENSRVVIGKLEFDQQNQAREAIFHLAVGKMRAVVSQAALTLVKARQSNFSISTQTAVAAVRGTDFEVTYDDSKQVMQIAVLPENRTGGSGGGRSANHPLGPTARDAMRTHSRVRETLAGLAAAVVLLAAAGLAEAQAKAGTAEIKSV